MTHTIHMGKHRGVLVLDLDETLGYWVTFGVLWDALTHLNGGKLGYEHFAFALDQFPELLRPGIQRTLRSVSRHKQRGACSMVALYTNNLADRSWAESIVRYLNEKAGSAVFDRVVCGHHCEPCRRSRRKTYGDLIKCCDLPNDTPVVFVDDQVHPGMGHANVSYIHVTPHMVRMSYEDMATRYIRALVPSSKAAAPEAALVEFCQGFGNPATYDTRSETARESEPLHRAIEGFFRPKRLTRRARVSR